MATPADHSPNITINVTLAATPVQEAGFGAGGSPIGSSSGLVVTNLVACARSAALSRVRCSWRSASRSSPAARPHGGPGR